MSPETRSSLGCLGIFALVLVLLACAAAIWVPALNARLYLWRISSGSIPAKGGTEFFYYNTYHDMIDRPGVYELDDYATERLNKQLGTEPFHFRHCAPEFPIDERSSTVWQFPGGYVCLTFGDYCDSVSIGLYAGEGQFLEKNEGRVYLPAQAPQPPHSGSPAP